MPAANITRLTWAHSTCRKKKHTHTTNGITRASRCEWRRKKNEKADDPVSSRQRKNNKHIHVEGKMYEKSKAGLRFHHCMFSGIFFFLSLSSSSMSFIVCVRFHFIRFENCFELDHIFYSAWVIYYSHRAFSFSLCYSIVYFNVCNLIVPILQMQWLILPNNLDDTSVNSIHLH